MEFDRLRRWLRPINLIVIHQALWPLLTLLGDGPRITEPAGLPWDWWGVRLAGPVLASFLALAYLRRDGIESRPPGDTRSLRFQIWVLLIGLPFMVAVVRLADGPTGSAARIVLFGAVDALAFQLVSFEIAGRLLRDRRQGAIAALVTFAGSWAARDAMLSIIGDAGGSLPLTIFGGLLAGLLIALGSLLLRRWPGGFWPAWGTQWLVISLIIGFS